jgi:putative flavoprotein involved in K+ transport
MIVDAADQPGGSWPRYYESLTLLSPARFSTLPLGRRSPNRRGVLDDGRYAAAVAAGRPDERRMFRRLTPDGVVWPDGTLEQIDSIILATGYRPDVDYLAPLGALDRARWPVHCRGLSLTVPRLAYVGLPGQPESRPPLSAVSRPTPDA